MKKPWSYVRAQKTADRQTDRPKFSEMCFIECIHDMFVPIIAATSRFNQLCNQIESELGTARSMRTSASIRTNWQERIVRSEESWEEVRPTICKEMISKEGYPQVNVSLSMRVFIGQYSYDVYMYQLQ